MLQAVCGSWEHARYRKSRLLYDCRTVVCERNNNGFRHMFYGRVLSWTNILATGRCCRRFALYLHHKFDAEMLSIRIRTFFRGPFGWWKSFLGQLSLHWRGFRGNTLRDNMLSHTHTHMPEDSIINVLKMYDVCRKRKIRKFPFLRWTFFPPLAFYHLEEQYLMMKNFSFCAKGSALA